MKDPSGQLEHAFAPTTAYFPAAHAMVVGDVAAGKGQAYPALQSMHSVAPATELYLPGMHASEAGEDDVDPGEHVYPGLQLVQLVAPGLENVPAGHWEGTMAPGGHALPAGHCAHPALPSTLYVPGAQAPEHWLEPGVENRPGPQAAVHAGVVSPVVLPNLPGGQFEQSATLGPPAL